jgi:hypothetical protein
MDELETLMAMADVIGVPPAVTALPRARPHIRRGAFEPAPPARDSAPDAGKEGMRAVLIGDYRTVSPPSPKIEFIDRRAGRRRGAGARKVWPGNCPPRSDHNPKVVR